LIFKNGQDAAKNLMIFYRSTYGRSSQRSMLGILTLWLDFI